MSDLVKRLRIKAGMIEMGEMIAWGSDSALMREAADALDAMGTTGLMGNYKLVPVEPTPEMVSAAEDAYMPFGDMELALRMAILAAPAVQGEPVAWQRVDRPERIITVLSRRTWKEVEDGVEFRALYVSPQPAEQQPDVAQLVNALESLVKGYVNLLEAGKDRITSLGGDCDPVPVMEHNDPWLRDARVALAPYRKGGEA